MKITSVTFPAPALCRMEVEEAAESYEHAVQARYLARRKFYTVSGYPKGEAPRTAIEARYGADVFRLDAINQALIYQFPAVQAEYCREHDLILLSEPETQLLREGADGFAVACTFGVVPKIALPRYTGRRFAGNAETEVKKLLAQIAKETEIPLPAELVEAEYRNRLAGLKRRLQSGGDTLPAFLARAGKTQEALRHDLQEDIRLDFRIRILLFNIAWTEGLNATQADIDRRIDEMVRRSAKNEYARTNLSAQRSIAARIAYERALTFVRENNRFAEEARPAGAFG